MSLFILLQSHDVVKYHIICTLKFQQGGGEVRVILCKCPPPPQKKKEKRETEEKLVMRNFFSFNFHYLCMITWWACCALTHIYYT